MAEYDDFHKFFLRNIMNKGVITVDDAEACLRKYFPEHLSCSDLIKDINRKIRPMQQQIKTIKDESSETKYLVFLNRAADDASKCQTVFAPNDLEYFKYLLEAIVMSSEKSINGILAINVASKIQNYSKTRAQELLKLWTVLHYLKKDLSGSYSLNIRTIHEFDSLLESCYSNILEKCFLCKKAIIQKTTACPSCGETYHNHCLQSYIQNITKWPCCKEIYEETRDEIHNSSERISQEYNTISIDEIASQLSVEDITQSTQNSSMGKGRKRNRL